MNSVKPHVVYYESQMRRALSIFFVLFFGLGPLAAALGEEEETRLPACCRRHGKHHCNMTMAMMAMFAAFSGPAWTAPPCPFYPTARTPVRIVTAYFAAQLPPSIEIHRDPAPPAYTQHRARTHTINSQSTRSPPARLA